MVGRNVRCEVDVLLQDAERSKNRAKYLNSLVEFITTTLPSK